MPKNILPKKPSPKNTLESRRKRYFRLSSAIAQLDNTRLRALLDDSEPTAGWGRNHTIEVGRSKVFVKRIPVTGIEYENLFSTANLYDLPTYYNYGVGSAGLGVFRELIANIKTTNWVLDGAIETFPLLYHYRILPFAGKRAEEDKERHRKYVEYWGSSENIGRYMLDRANAPYELDLFIEHIPYVLGAWLSQNPRATPWVLESLRQTVDFLRKNGIIHFDAHFWNILTDGERTYLTDFGLVLDRSFTLSEDEQAFFSRNTCYDYGEVLSALRFFIFSALEALSDEEKRSLSERYGSELQRRDLADLLLDNIEHVHATGALKLGKGHVDSLVRYRSVIRLMQDFYSNLSRNHNKDTKLRHDVLKRGLTETGFLIRA